MKTNKQLLLDQSQFSGISLQSCNDFVYMVIMILGKLFSNFGLQINT